MVRLAKLLFLLSLSLSAAGQSPIDSLKQRLNTVQAPREKAGLYGHLGLEMLGVNDSLAAVYITRAVDLAQKGGYQPELARAYLGKAYVAARSGDNTGTCELADTAYQMAKTSNDLWIQFNAVIAGGAAKRRLAKFDEALQYYLKALSIAEARNDLAFIGLAHNCLGVVYVTINDLARARHHHQQALSFRLKTQNHAEIFSSYENLGIIKREEKQYDSALHFYRKGAEHAVKAGDSSALAFVYNDMGAGYSFLGNYDEAEKYLKASIDIRERTREGLELAYTYNYLGENYERKKDLKTAEYYIRKALSTAKETENNKQTYEALESLSDFFARNARYDSAYRYAVLFRRFRDSVSGEAQKKIIAELNTRYETTQKERRIQQQEYEISKRNYWLGGVSLLLVLGTSLLYNTNRKQKLKREAAFQANMLQQQKQASQAIMEAEENERARIASDLHDGIGQMMSAANLNLSSLKTGLSFPDPQSEQDFDRIVSLVDESCRELRNVSHNIMPNALLKGGLASALRDFIHKIDHRTIKVNIYTDGLHERLDVNTETILYRIIQECVNNVIKHAKANSLDITVIRDDQEISVTVEDNGIGFDTQNQPDGGIGLKNIRSRVNYLRGTVEWDSAPGKGTVVAINIPTVQIPGA